MGKFGYDFYFKIGDEVLTLPITPPSFKMTVGSNNKVVTLIDEGDINILKSPSLAEFEFEARFPMRKYPYSRDPLNFEVYLNKFTALMTEKTPFILNVVRTTPDGRGTWATVRRVTLEDLEVNEDADEGDDVIVSFNLKEYKEYGVVTHNQSTNPDTTSTSEKPRANDNKATKPVTYVVRNGDTLWAIAKAHYNDGSKWTAIYEANKNVIESTAEKRRGKGKGSSNGHWIYAGTELVIPDATTAQTLKNSKASATYYSVTITPTGNKDYRGEIAIDHTFNGKKVTTKNVGGSSVAAMCDANTNVTVFVYKPPEGHSFVIENMVGKWNKHSAYRYDLKITKNSSFTVRYVR